MSDKKAGIGLKLPGSKVSRREFMVFSGISAAFSLCDPSHLINVLGGGIPDLDFAVTNKANLIVVGMLYRQNSEKYSAPLVVVSKSGGGVRNLLGYIYRDGVPVFEDDELAWDLLDKLEPGDEISRVHYEVVAEILVDVYRMDKKEDTLYYGRDKRVDRVYMVKRGNGT